MILQTPSLLIFNIKPFLFILSILAFLLDLIFAAFFFIKYLKNQRQNKFLLFASLALFFIYWIRLPFALNLIGFSFVIENFYLFFAVFLPFYIIALIFIILALQYLCPQLCKKRINIFFCSWAIVALISAAYYFFSYKGLFVNYMPVKTLYYVFVFPARVVIFLLLLRTFFGKDMSLTKIQKIGLFSLFLNNFLGAAVNYFNYAVMLNVPPQFWFLPVAGYSIAYIWEFFNSILLIGGFLLIAKDFKNDLNQIKY